MAYRLVIDDKVLKDLKKIDREWQRRIVEVMKTRLVDDPYGGKKLVGDLSPYYRWRVGDYRIVYEVLEEEVVVLVVRVRHRREVWR